MLGSTGGPRSGYILHPASVGTPCVAPAGRARRGRLRVASLLSRRKKFSEEIGALGGRVCTLFARVHVTANVQTYICVHVCMQVLTCLRVRLCMHVPVQVCTCISVHACICVCVCARASGPAICDEGIPKQRRAARGQLPPHFSSLSLTGTRNSAARAATLFRQSVGSAWWRCR